jgi:GWxTD domain-containing protein
MATTLLRTALVHTLLTFLLLAVGIAGAIAEPSPPRTRDEAAALYQRSLGLLARGTLESRRQALRDLERATLLDPDSAAYQLTLARAYQSAGFLKGARDRYQRVASLRPADVSGHLGLARMWRRDWLKFLDAASLDRAIAEFTAAGRLDSADVDLWLELAPLQIERGDLPAACATAFRALRLAPGRGDAHLAVAHALYRSGMLPEADSAYRTVLPGLAPAVRRCFEDISPVASEADTAILNHLPPSEQPAFIERFWRENDPDLSTPVNEARLAYWARATQAYFLFYDRRRREWDERGEIYVRYGPPAEMAYNPIGQWGGRTFATTPPDAANLVAWSYPELGMLVTLQDRLLSEHYLLPVSTSHSTDPVPDPTVLAHLGGALGTRGGRGVFPLLPPGATPLPLRSTLARFEADGRPRLLLQFETAGGPTDELRAEWSVLDTAGVVRARAERPLAPSACEATTRQVGDFSAELPPGPYTVSLTVHDGADRRGVLRRTVELPAPATGLALSDVVVACGPPEGGSTVRIEPNPGARVGGAGPLTAYFEIYHLRADRDGLARFEYVYTVRSTARDTRHWVQKLLVPAPPPAVSVSREEQHLGGLRRQFISVPVTTLPPGGYRLEITVRDLVAGEEVVRRVDFVRTG